MSEQQIAFSAPVYCMKTYPCPSFLERNMRLAHQIVVSGGGGSGRSGIKNYLAIGGIKRSPDGTLYFKAMTMEDTGDDLIHQVLPASNGRFLFGSLRDGTVVYRVTRGDSEDTVKLERVLFKATESQKSHLQNVVIAKSDDVTLLTGGEDGTVIRWHFGLKDAADRSCELVEEERLHLFDRPVTSLTLNTTENYCLAGSESGEVAVVDLKTNGIVQRIPAPRERCSVQQLFFPSSSTLLVLFSVSGGASLLQLLVPKMEEEAVRWTVDRERFFKNRTVCRMNENVDAEVVLLGDNEGEVGALEYPSLRPFMRFASAHALPVTSLIDVEDDLALATVRERVKKEKTEWIVSSSVDYTVSVLPLKRTAHVVDAASVVFLLFVLLMVLYGVYVLRK